MTQEEAVMVAGAAGLVARVVAVAAVVDKGLAWEEVGGGEACSAEEGASVA